MWYFSCARVRYQNRVQKGFVVSILAHSTHLDKMLNKMT